MYTPQNFLEVLPVAIGVAILLLPWVITINQIIENKRKLKEMDEREKAKKNDRR